MSVHFHRPSGKHFSLPLVGLIRCQALYEHIHAYLQVSEEYIYLWQLLLFRNDALLPLSEESVELKADETLTLYCEPDTLGICIRPVSIHRAPSFLPYHHIQLDVYDGDDRVFMCQWLAESYAPLTQCTPVSTVRWKNAFTPDFRTVISVCSLFDLVRPFSSYPFFLVHTQQRWDYFLRAVQYDWLQYFKEYDDL
jgi:hypothetical protein